MKDFKEYTILNAVTPVVVISSTDATPIVVTATAHGFSNDDLITIIGHTTNIAANGFYRVANVAANTFELVNKDTRANIAGTGAGAGADGIVMIAPKVPLGIDFINAMFSIFTSGTTTATVKIMSSMGNTDGESPDFAALPSPTNMFEVTQSIYLKDGSSVSGADGAVATAADIGYQYEMNTNGEKFLTAFPVTWTQGAITIKLLLTDNT